jgi:hypothetical protein
MEAITNARKTKKEIKEKFDECIFKTQKNSEESFEEPPAKDN